MPYCKREEQESRAVARFNAVHEVLKEHRTPAEVTRRFGVYDSTIKLFLDIFQNIC